MTNLIHHQLEKTIRQIDTIENDSCHNLRIELNKHQQEIIYQTSYCLQIAKYSQASPLLLANKIVNKLNHLYKNQDLMARVSGQGWLEFRVSDRLIEKYLNSIDKNPLRNINTTSIKNFFPEKTEISFIKYYIQNRCFSLLKSAHNQKIIQLNNLDFTLNQWQIIQPKNNYYSIFYSSNYSEQKIIKELFLIIEKIETKKNKNNKILLQLEKIFFELESNSRIWGETLIRNRQLSQARLGLIGLILHCYQNIFYLQYQQQLPPEKYH